MINMEILNVFMGIFRQFIGLVLIIIAWFNFLDLGDIARIIVFIIGFDMLNLFSKILVFGVDYFIGLSGLGLILGLIVLVEVLATLLFLGKFLNYILKPFAVFIILFTNGIALEIAIIVAGIDLLLNMTKR